MLQSFPASTTTSNVAETSVGAFAASEGYTSNDASSINLYQRMIHIVIDTVFRPATFGHISELAIASKEQSLESLKDFVRELAMLEESWDGYDASPISKNIIAHTMRLIDIVKTCTFLPNPDITPLSNGTISLEWESKSGVAYLEIGNTNYSGFIKVGENQKPLYLQGKSASIDQFTLADIYSNLFGLDLFLQSVTNIKYMY